MVEILIRGIPPEEYTYTVTCGGDALHNGCGSKLKFKRSEAKTQQENYGQSYKYFVCPVCGSMIINSLDDYDQKKIHDAKTAENYYNK